MMASRRRFETRKPRDRILILCEGKKTEPKYFKGLKADRDRVSGDLTLDILDSDMTSAVELVEEAKRLIKQAKREDNPYAEVWIVVDRDSYPRHATAFSNARDVNNPSIHIAFSSICFEYWYLLHFAYTARSFAKADTLISHLKKKHMTGYRKSGDYYDDLKEMTDTAIKHARQLRRTHLKPDIDAGKKPYELKPYTDVDKLVRRLMGR